jgi:hypothetical protein
VSVRWEFANATSSRFALMGPDEVFEESGGTRIRDNELALAVNYDEVFVLVGTREQLLQLAERIKSLATKPLPALPDGADGCPVCGADLVLYERQGMWRRLQWHGTGADCYMRHAPGWHAGDSDYGDDSDSEEVQCDRGHRFAVPTIEEWG